MINNTNTLSQETQLDKVIDRIRSYGNPPLAANEPLHLDVDGLSENPGVMGGGIYIRQADRCFAAEAMFLGHGTCNEAEYLALINGLRIVQAIYPKPGVPIIAQSDSQLVVRQVEGAWKAKPRMQGFCRALMRLRIEYPFQLVKVPREQNTMADALAQQIVLKHSGRSLSLENGRFDRSKQVPARMGSRDTYIDLTTQEFRDYIERFNLRDNFRQLRDLIAARSPDEAAALVGRTLTLAEQLLAGAPKTNAVIARWADDTAGIIRTSLDQILKGIEQWDLDSINYYLDEMAGAPSDTDGEGMFSQELDFLRDGMGLGQFVELSDEGGLCHEEV